MSDAIYQATAGALIQQYRLDVLSNNIANINTVGFKEDRLSFQVLKPEQPPSQDGAESEPVILPSMTGEPSVAYYVNFSQGPLQHTGNPLDIAIEGKGFFAVQTPDGIQYTRKGDFELSEDGLLITREGYPIQGDGGPISLDGEKIVIDRDGSIWLDNNLVGSFQIHRFTTPENLQKTGHALFIPSDGETPATVSESFEIMQGYVELSNVDAVQGMVDMIEALRAFEAYQKMLQTLAEVDSQAVNEVGDVI